MFQDQVKEPVDQIITEDIKQASKYLEEEITPDIHLEGSVVADALSDRVGLPKYYPNEPNPLKIEKSLNKERLNYERDLEKLNNWLVKREGTKLEGTGVSVFGVGGVSLIIIVILLCILFPAFIPIFINIVQMIMGTSRAIIKGATNNIVDAIEEYKKERPEEAKELLHKLSKNLDKEHKILVEKIKKKKV